GAATNNKVGDTPAGARNVISGNVYGVDIQGAGTNGNLVQGNWIGTNGGGTVAGAANTIAYNSTGVQVDGASTAGDSILANSIFGNTGFGILLTTGGN